MGAIENKKLRFDSAKFEFTDSRIRVVEIYPSRLFPLYELCRQFSFGINADCLHLNGHISSMAQIVDALGQVLSAVEHLILDYDEDSWFSDGDYEVEIDHTWLYKLFIPFSNVKNLRVNYRIVEEFSRYLRMDDGVLPLELLPRLQELTYSGICFSNSDDAFTSFTDARQNAGHPISLVRIPSPSPSSEWPAAYDES